MSARIRYTRQNIITNTFYQLPKFLFDTEFAGLTNDARVLYALLRNRHEISIKNGWYDENDEVYLYFKREEMQAILGLSDKPVAKAMKDLMYHSLLEEKQQGFMKPNKIYLLAVAGTLHGIGGSAENAGNTMTRRFSESRHGDCPTHDMEILRPNHKEIDSHNEIYNNNQKEIHNNNQKEIYNPSPRNSVQSSPVSQVSQNKPDEQDETVRKIDVYTDLIKGNIGYIELIQSRQYDIGLVNEFISIIIDTVITEGGTVRVGKEDKPRELVKSQLLKLNYEDIDHAIDQFKNVTERVIKKKQYILTMLYNCKMERDSHYTNAVRSDIYMGGDGHA